MAWAAVSANGNKGLVFVLTTLNLNVYAKIWRSFCNFLITATIVLIFSASKMMLLVMVSVLCVKGLDVLASASYLGLRTSQIRTLLRIFEDT